MKRVIIRQLEECCARIQDILANKNSDLWRLSRISVAKLSSLNENVVMPLLKRVLKIDASFREDVEFVKKKIQKINDEDKFIRSEMKLAMLVELDTRIISVLIGMRHKLELEK